MKFTIPIITHQLGARNSTSQITKITIHTKTPMTHNKKGEIIA